MINRRRLYGRRRFCLAKCCVIGLLIITLPSILLNTVQEDQHIEIGNENHRIKILLKTLERLVTESNYTYEKFIQWNRSLCSNQSDHRGPHQKVITLSIYGTTSKFTDNAIFSWNKSILPFLQPLADEVKLLLPSWIIRVYIDFTGSTKSQRDFLYNFSNIDVCDITNIPMFSSSLLAYLPGKMWRFLPIFDPYVDYVLSRDLDSPIIPRETETIDLWLSDDQKRNFFYIARDHIRHRMPILGGLWGAATVRARHYLFVLFQPILIPSIGWLYTAAGDQQFLEDFIWKKVKESSLIFDSYYCKPFGGRPFLSQRPAAGNCFLGCIRPCCINTTNDGSLQYVKPCPIACRPKTHRDWTYC
jgi:hypothetical protein